jgi:hypothetical protein
MIIKEIKLVLYRLYEIFRLEVLIFLSPFNYFFNLSPFKSNFSCLLSLKHSYIIEKLKAEMCFSFQISTFPYQ